MDPTYRVTQVSLFPRVAPVGARRPTGAAVVALVDERALAMWHQHGPRLQGYISVTLHEAPSMVPACRETQVSLSMRHQH
eukprot:1179983-Prorocentrum_minimum.AAC.2